jgi:predicted amidohydrolase YtcJ
MSMGGALESRTEVMLDDGYRNGSDVQQLIPSEAFAAYVGELDAAGVQIKVHAVGDGTVRAVLDGYEPTIRSRGENTLRHHIDHCSYVAADDMVRMAELDVGCSAWPMLGAPHGFITNQADLVTEEKFAEVAPHRSLLDAGVPMANHSDAPQANLWPWWGMEATITRGFPGEPSMGTLPLHQALTLEQTLKVHTINGAWILRLDDVTGSIEEGKWADMIVLNHNLFEIPATEIHNTQVQRTIFKGEVVYERR